MEFKNPKNHLIIGITRNWGEAFNHNPPIWGFTEKESSAWEQLSSGDIIYLYAAREARGIGGKGLVLNKFKGEDPNWLQEREIGRAIWTLRFYFQPLRLLPGVLWKAGKGPIQSRYFDIEGTGLQGKQIIGLSSEQVGKIEKAINKEPFVIAGYQIEPELEPAKIAEIVLPYTSDHQRLIKVIGEMGSLQNFYPQPEFTIPDENRRIDVIWKRETRGTPTYAFEVELSGGLDKALNKLHKCFRLWSTLPRVVTPTQDQSKIPNIASSYDLQFQKSIVCITPEQVQDIYAKKKSFKDLESKIGLL